MKNLINSESLKEIIQLYALFLILTLVIYKAPQVISLIVQVIMLIVFYRSKKGYFWFALVFIAESQPGALFIITDAKHSFSLLQNTPLGLLYFNMVFTAVATVKAYGIRPRYPLFFRNIIIVMVIYIFVLLIAFKIHKLSYFGGFLPWFFPFILPRIFKDIEDYERFFSLIFSFVFFVLITQIYYLLNGSEINVLLGGMGNAGSQMVTVEYAGTALRPVMGIPITFFAVIGCAYFIVYKKSNISKYYLYVVLVTAYFSIFLTATRGWILAATLIVAGMLFINSKNPFAIIPKFVLPIILLLVIFNFVPLLKKQSDLVITRLETLVSFSEGDVTAGGTLSRLDERGPRVMNKFYESPILGFGFGTEGIEFSDNHVGNQNLLMRSGIIGFALFVILIGFFILVLLYKNREILDPNYKNMPLIVIVSLLSIVIIHSTSSQWFHYSFGFIRGFIFFFILVFGNFVYMESAPRINNQSI